MGDRNEAKDTFDELVTTWMTIIQGEGGNGFDCIPSWKPSSSQKMTGLAASISPMVFGLTRSFEENQWCVTFPRIVAKWERHIRCELPAIIVAEYVHQHTDREVDIKRSQNSAPITFLTIFRNPDVNYVTIRHPGLCWNDIFVARFSFILRCMYTVLSHRAIFAPKDHPGSHLGRVSGKMNSSNVRMPDLGP